MTSKLTRLGDNGVRFSFVVMATVCIHNACAVRGTRKQLQASKLSGFDCLYASDNKIGFTMTDRYIPIADESKVETQFAIRKRRLTSTHTELRRRHLESARLRPTAGRLSRNG